MQNALPVIILLREHWQSLLLGSFVSTLPILRKKNHVFDMDPCSDDVLHNKVALYMNLN